LYRDPRSDMPVTQFNMKYVELAGLVKFDFLGLKTLTVLARARDLIREHTPDFDLDSLPLDKDAAYELMARGDTVGIFQLESAGVPPAKEGGRRTVVAPRTTGDDTEGNLQDNDQPDAGHADRAGVGRLIARSGRPAPPRQGQEAQA